jgi:hypothetical protein
MIICELFHSNHDDVIKENQEQKHSFYILISLERKEIYVSSALNISQIANECKMDVGIRLNPHVEERIAWKLRKSRALVNGFRQELLYEENLRGFISDKAASDDNVDIFEYIFMKHMKE